MLPAGWRHSSPAALPHHNRTPVAERPARIHGPAWCGVRLPVQQFGQSVTVRVPVQRRAVESVGGGPAFGVPTVTAPGDSHPKLPADSQRIVIGTTLAGPSVGDIVGKREKKNPPSEGRRARSWLLSA
jgi:hypothetical protein